MKKYLSILILLTLPLVAFAQNCTPDQSLNNPGYYPQQLPVGSSGAAYTATVQFVIPQDTQVVYMGSSVNATIDSIKVHNVEGLPSSLNYACNPQSCVLPGGQTSCGTFYGTIDSSESGTFPIMIPVTFYVRIGGSFPVQQKDTLKNFSLDVQGPNAIEGVIFKKLMVYPNPTNADAHLLLPEETKDAKVTLFNTSGQAVSIGYQNEGREIKLETATLRAGIYYGTVSTEQHIYRFKLIRR